MSLLGAGISKGASLLGRLVPRLTGRMSAAASARAISYDACAERLRGARAATLGDQPLTATEKILYSHLHNPAQDVARGESYLLLRPDRVALQDASAQTAVLQFMLTGLDEAAVPTSVHCDHLIVGSTDGGAADLQRAIADNREVFDFLKSASNRYGLHFWAPGSGIIHQIVLENYALPGQLMVGCDSHTPNAGGLGGIAIGVGGADAVDVMSDMPWELRAPRVLGVRLEGELQGWASPKDVILKLAGMLTVKGGTGYVVEYTGPGADTLSCTGMATICNMGAEIGATSSFFPYSASQAEYLSATGRDGVRQQADRFKGELLHPDPGCRYDDEIVINLSELEPHFNGPFTPDNATALSEFGSTAADQEWPMDVSAALIGSCTNSSYEDMTKAASIAQQAANQGLKTAVPFFVTPGSAQIYETCKRDGILDLFEQVGGTILANACGPCIGQWARPDMDNTASNSILTSFNRNFSARNDGNKNTHNFLGSPEVVTAMAFAGRLDYNPATDAIKTPSGDDFTFAFPDGVTLPAAGFAPAAGPHADGEKLGKAAPALDASVVIDDASTRLQRLEPFPGWDGADMHDLQVLIKVTGKCTTDHISAAGPWLKYKGHLENISENTLITAVNADGGELNSVHNALDGTRGTIPDVAKAYKAAGVGWVVIGDHNYGEGSAREHAAMQPRFLGGRAVICKSFARIHETNLKKQGMLPLTFADPADYDKVPTNSKVSILGFGGEAFSPETQLTLRVQPVDGEGGVDLPLQHTMSEDQITWFTAGSALNNVAAAAAARG